ncbi:hypothetical protein JOC75_000331 [Metabacillus crassostreae]|uniref:hypothetical protein n=1 Tax=Metabacillus crassostreae TaxID=929098 RepID=UPI00195D4B34|nr:hypothetical protein [Metabacillus crassostreae]MBM7602361.1 hypothetical protein [Metabacillus crassostreae]
MPTLLLPIVIPYGDPYTMVNPSAHHMRKVEFFQWVQSTNSKYQMFRDMPLRITGDLETEGNSIIEGFQEDTTNFVPSNPTTQSILE